MDIVDGMAAYKNMGTTPSKEMKDIWKEKEVLLKAIKKKHGVKLSGVGTGKDELKLILKNGMKVSVSERAHLDKLNSMFL